MLSFRNLRRLLLIGSALLMTVAPGLGNASTASVVTGNRATITTPAVVFANIPSDLAGAETREPWTTGTLEGYSGFKEAAMAVAPDASLDASTGTAVPDGGASKARVPEPAALLLFGSGLIALARISRKRS